MAHEIEASDVFGEVRVRGQRAWHGLGVEIPDGMKAWEAFQHVGLAWETEMRPLFTNTSGGVSMVLENYSAHMVVGDDRLLGVVGAGYKPISNRSLAEFADALAGAGKDVVTETAGSLRNGRCVYVLVKLPLDIEVTEEDILRQYILIRNSHDGSTSFQVYPTSVRVVCANTLRLSEKSLGKGVQFQHTGDIQQKITMAQMTLGIVTEEVKKFEAQVRLLAAKHVKAADVREYFCSVYDATQGVLPLEDSKRYIRQLERRDALLARWEANLEHAHQAMDGVRGTMWAAYNAVSQWADHERGNLLSVYESESRVHSNLFGVAHSDKHKAFGLALGAV